MGIKMKKNILLGALALVSLSGCFSTQYYVLSMASTPVHTYHDTHLSIGIEKVSLPHYLFKREIAVASSSNAIHFLSDTWAESLDKGLTHRLVSFMQKKFNQPYVNLYPWGVGKQPDRRVKVAVSRFIAKGESVYLDANWEIENMHTHTISAKLFSTRIPCSDNAESIVSAMDEAFTQLEEKISQAVEK